MEQYKGNTKTEKNYRWLQLRVPVHCCHDEQPPPIRQFAWQRCLLVPFLWFCFYPSITRHPHTTNLLTAIPLECFAAALERTHMERGRIAPLAAGLPHSLPLCVKCHHYLSACTTANDTSFLPTAPAPGHMSSPVRGSRIANHLKKREKLNEPQA